jgi:hypothetical protein
MTSNRLGWMEYQAQRLIIRSRRRNYLSFPASELSFNYRVQDGKVVCIDQSSSFRGDSLFHHRNGFEPR